MTAIHYFQRYSQPENVATNNTLLLLSRIQANDPRRLRAVLEELLCDGDAEILPIGVQFSQQKSAPESVPDGTLYQPSFRIVVETKRTESFSREQLVAHLGAFGNEDTKILLLLAPRNHFVDMSEARDRGVRVLSRTFLEVVDACRAVGLHEDIELRELIDDYEAFCFDSGLILNEDARVMVITAGTTLGDNRELRLYYAPVDRGYQAHRYIGLYQGKTVCAIGRETRVVEADRDGENLIVPSHAVPLNDDERRRIMAAMDRAAQYGYRIDTGHRFFLVDAFHDTDFRKTTKGALRGKRYFDLRDQLGLEARATLPAIEQIARALRDQTWS